LPNDALHWRRASDAQFDTTTESRRPVHVPLGHSIIWPVMSSQKKYRQSGKRQERDDTEKPYERRQLATAKRPRKPQIFEKVCEVQTVASAEKHDRIRRRPGRNINNGENDRVSQECSHGVAREMA
jgi:hypothetical protein